MRKPVLAGALIAASAAHATAVLYQSFEEMTAAALVVVRGTVGPQETHWDPTHRAIYRYVEINVRESIKGRPGSVLLVRAPGGVAEGIGQRVEGSPEFVGGEDVVLFLERAPDEPGVLQVSAYSAGKIRLETSKVGALRATRDLRGIGFYHMGAKGPLEVHAVEDLGSADAFLARIRRAVR